MIKMSYSMCVIFVIGGSGFRRVEIVIIIVMMGGLLPMFSSWARYVLNK